MLGALFENHFAAEADRAERMLNPNGHSTARLPRERKLLDPEMGQVTIVPRAPDDANNPALQGAWTGMTQLPSSILAELNPQPSPQHKRPPSSSHTLAAMREAMQSDTLYNATAEAHRRERLQRERDRWETATCTALPSCEGVPNPSPPCREAHDVTPFATAVASTPRADDSSLAPRGKAPGLIRANDMEQPLRRVRKAAPEGNPTRSEQSNFAVAAMSDVCQFALGNPRAESFVLKSRAMRRAVPGAANKSSSEPSEPVASRRVFAEQTGGGASAISFDGHACSAQLPPDKFGRRRLEGPIPTRPLRTGKKHLPPPRDNPELFRAPLEPPPTNAKPNNQLPHVSPDAQAFVDWYRHKYGEVPPPELVRRAQASQLASPRVDVAPPPQQKHQPPSAVEQQPPPSKHTAPPIEGAMRAHASIRRNAKPPGGTSTINLSWDDT